MIPAVLPPPTADAGSAAAVDRADAAGFEHALRRETGQGARSSGADRGRPDRGREDDAPGEHGRDQALVAMPVHAPAQPVVAGLVHDARPAVDVALAELDVIVAADLDAVPIGADVPAADPVDDIVPGTAPEPGDPEPAEVPPEAAVGRAEAGSDDAIAAEPLETSSTGAEPAPEDGPVLPDAPDDAGTPTRSVETPDGLTGTGDTAPTGAEPLAPSAEPTPARSVAEATPARQDAAPAPAPVAAPAPAVATAPSAPTPPITPPAVAQQLVEHVSPLVHGPDGTHDLTIELRPATLGLVRLEVTLEDGTLHVRVHAEDPSSRRLLAQSLGELRSALTGAGIDAGRLDVGDPGGRDRPSSGTGGERRHPQGTDPAAPAPTAAPPRNQTAGTTSVDVLL